jgi:hypothetical protein
MLAVEAPPDTLAAAQFVKTPGARLDLTWQSRHSSATIDPRRRIPRKPSLSKGEMSGSRSSMHIVDDEDSAHDTDTTMGVVVQFTLGLCLVLGFCGLTCLVLQWHQQI